jgi:hypothetical protein
MRLARRIEQLPGIAVDQHHALEQRQQRGMNGDLISCNTPLRTTVTSTRPIRAATCCGWSFSSHELPMNSHHQSVPGYNTSSWKGAPQNATHNGGQNAGVSVDAS